MEIILLFLRRHLKAIWRRRWLGLGVAWLVCLLGWVGLSMVPNSYEVSARIYVDVDAVLTPLLKGLAADTTPDTKLQVLQQTLLSRPNMETLISKSDLDLRVTGPGSRERMVDNLMKDISVQTSLRPDSRNLFTVSYSNADPKLAQSVVQTLLSIFIDNATRTNRQDMENARVFLEHQIASYGQQLRTAEQRRAEFRSKYAGLLSLDGRDPNTQGANSLELLQTQIAQVQAQLGDKTAEAAALQKEIATIPPMLVTEQGSGSGGLDPVSQAEDRVAMLRNQYTDAYPGLIAAEQQLATLKAAKTKGRGQKSTPNPVYDQIKMKLIDTQASMVSLTRQLGAMRENLTQLQQLQRDRPNIIAEYQNLDRGYGVLQKNYDELLTRLQSADLGEAADTQADQVKIRLIDPPDIPRIPTSPPRLLIASGILIAGLAIGAVIPALLSQFDQSFWVLEDLRSIGLPVLGAVSLVSALPRRRQVMSSIRFGFAVLVLIALYGGLMFHILNSTAII